MGLWALGCAAHSPQPLSSPLQQRRFIDRPGLLEKIPDVALPVTRFAEPGKGAGKRRVLPSLHDPRGVVQHAQRPQRLDQGELPRVDLAELRIALDDLAPFALLLGRITRE